MSERQRTSIWIVIGTLLIVWGFVMIGQAAWKVFFPAAPPVLLTEPHASMWWGSGLLIVGALCVGANARW